jgi:putative intracellular protease/amidase
LYVPSRSPWPPPPFISLVVLTTSTTSASYVGGHGPVIDLPVDTVSQNLIQDFYSAGKITAAVCHAPAVFIHTKKADGTPLIAGKKFTGFSNSEERA